MLIYEQSIMQIQELIMKGKLKCNDYSGVNYQRFYMLVILQRMKLMENSQEMNLLRLFLPKEPMFQCRIKILLEKNSKRIE